MLVLHRKTNQRILMQLPSGEQIEITILDHWDGRMRLGIEAPDDVKIYRDEVWDRIRRDGEAA